MKPSAEKAEETSLCDIVEAVADVERVVGILNNLDNTERKAQRYE